MKLSWLIIGVIVAGLAFAAAPVVPAQAQAKRVIRIVATSYKYEPNLIQVRQGEAVVLQLVNADTRDGATASTPSCSPSAPRRIRTPDPRIGAGEERQRPPRGNRVGAV